METQLNAPGAMGVVQSASRIPKAASLQAKPRLGEWIIENLLFISGAISILTTVGIVLVLATESSSFFSSWGFLPSEHETATAFDDKATTIPVTDGGIQFKAGDTVEIEGELMKVVSYGDNTLTVERGFDGSKVYQHPEGAIIHLAEKVGIVEFLTNTTWQPQAAEFGILPLVTATLTTSAIAMLVAIPLGLGAALYLSEYATLRVRTTLKPILELLAGVPTVVYGYFALTFMTPILRIIFGESTVGVYNMASAGLVMGIMIIPTIASMSEDALSAVPRSLREASYGVGATRLETSFRVLIPAALSGIVAAFILGISRAVGETMIVAIAAGAGPKFTLNPLDAAETMTGHIARISTGDLSYGTIDYRSLFAIGLTLFIITLVLNLLSNAIIRRYRQVYA
jgi:phosphate transport system permease protein